MDLSDPLKDRLFRKIDFLALFSTILALLWFWTSQRRGLGLSPLCISLRKEGIFGVAEVVDEVEVEVGVVLTNVGL